MGLTFSDLSHDNSSKYGYHILRVQQNSPAQQAGLQPFFDFILSIDGCSIECSAVDLHRELSRRLGRPARLTVYSSRLRRTRRVALVPRDNWGGQGLLGASVRLCSLAGEPALAWRVLDVPAGSPASLAGLRPGTDFIVGAEAPLQSAEDLFDLVEARARCPTRLYVYCSRGDRCREVTVTPDPGWGGEGALGCGIGYGYLHQIPAAAAAADDDDQDEGEEVPEENCEYDVPSPSDPRHAYLPDDLPSAPESAAAAAKSAAASAVATDARAAASSVTVV